MSNNPNKEHKTEEPIIIIHEIGLDALYANDEVILNCEYLFVIDCPVAVDARINSAEAYAIPINTVRKLSMPIASIFITTLATSSTPLKLLATNSDVFAAFVAANLVRLIDSSEIEYDARLAKTAKGSFNQAPALPTIETTVEIIDMDGYRSALVQMKNSTDVEVEVKIYGSNDGSMYKQINATETMVVTSGTYEESVSDPWAYIKTTYKPAGAGTSGVWYYRSNKRS